MTVCCGPQAEIASCMTTSHPTWTDTAAYKEKLARFKEVQQRLDVLSGSQSTSFDQSPPRVTSDAAQTAPPSSPPHLTPPKATPTSATPIAAPPPAVCIAQCPSCNHQLRVPNQESGKSTYQCPRCSACFVVAAPPRAAAPTASAAAAAAASASNSPLPSPQLPPPQLPQLPSQLPTQGQPTHPQPKSTPPQSQSQTSQSSVAQAALETPPPPPQNLFQAACPRCSHPCRSTCHRCKWHSLPMAYASYGICFLWHSLPMA